MMAGKVVGFGFEIISKLDSYLLKTLLTLKFYLVSPKATVNDLIALLVSKK